MCEEQKVPASPGEALFPLNDASHRFVNQPAESGGRKPAYVTLHRWASKGCRGHVLETWLVGGRRYTSKEAIQRFIAALNFKSRNPAGGGFSNPNRREQERIERELDELGL